MNNWLSKHGKSGGSHSSDRRSSTGQQSSNGSDVPNPQVSAEETEPQEREKDLKTEDVVVPNTAEEMSDGSETTPKSDKNMIEQIADKREEELVNQSTAELEASPKPTQDLSHEPEVEIDNAHESDTPAPPDADHKEENQPDYDVLVPGKTDDVIFKVDTDLSDEPADPADPEPADPEPADPEPADPEPADPEPADPEPADPEPADPEPADPEPAGPEPAGPEPDDPEPADPEPADPEHAGPEPADPEPADPEPADPEPADPEPADPEPADPEPADPEPADPEPADPEPAGPEPADPEPADPEPADPEPADPEPADPEPDDPEPADPEPADPEPADPEPVDPEPVDPEPADPEPVDPEPADPEPADPEPANPEVVDPEPVDSESADPELVDPEHVDPESADTESVDPESADPESADPELVDSELVDPEPIDPKPASVSGTEKTETDNSEYEFLIEPMESFASETPSSQTSTSTTSSSIHSSVPPTSASPGLAPAIPTIHNSLPAPPLQSANISELGIGMLDAPAGGGARLRSNSSTMRDLLPRFRRGSRSKLDKIGRIPIREGELFRVTKKGPKAYVFHLFNDALTYSETTRRGMKMKNSVEMSAIELSDMDDYKIGKKEIKFVFSIKTDKDELIVCAPSQELKEVWMFDIIKCITPFLTVPENEMKVFDDVEPDIDDIDILSDDEAETTAMEERIAKLEKQFKKKVKLQKRGRRFMREGELRRVTRKDIKKYTFHLFNDILVYSEKSTLGLKIHRILEISSLVISDQDDEEIGNKEMKYMFSIASGEKSFVVCAPTQDDKELWMMDITRCIAPFIGDTAEAVKEKMKQQAPIWVNNKSSNKCQLCHSSFSAFNRKHHCRKCGALCCSDCTPDRRIVPQLNSKKSVRVCIWCVEELPAL